MKSSPQILIFYTDFNLSRLLKLIILLIINNIINFNISTGSENTWRSPITKNFLNAPHTFDITSYLCTSGLSPDAPLFESKALQPCELSPQNFLK